MDKRKFIVNNDEGGFVVVQEGDLGYFEPPMDIPDAYEAARINCMVLGNSPAEVQAAKAASMFGWDCYEKVLAWEKRKNG